MGYYFIIKDNNEIWRKSTLAQMLDKRKISIGEPTEANLPRTVNPLKSLLIAMSNHLRVIKIRQSSIRNDYTHCLPRIKDMLSPGTSIIIVKELEPLSDIFLKSDMTETISTGTALSFSDTFQKGLLDG